LTTGFFWIVIVTDTVAVELVTLAGRVLRETLRVTVVVSPSTASGGSVTLLMLVRSATEPVTSTKSGSIVMAVIR